MIQLQGKCLRLLFVYKVHHPCVQMVILKHLMKTFFSSCAFVPDDRLNPTANNTEDLLCRRK